jgi:ABC-type microcin C transport system permease subunit YejB
MFSFLIETLLSFDYTRLVLRTIDVLPSYFESIGISISIMGVSLRVLLSLCTEMPLGLKGSIRVS